METVRDREETKTPQPSRRPRAPGLGREKTLREADRGRRRSHAIRGMGQRGREEAETKGIIKACKWRTPPVPGPSMV